MGGNLHRGFESLPLRWAQRLAHGYRRLLVAAPAPAALEVAEETAERSALHPVVRIAGERVELPPVALQPVQLAVTAPVADEQPAARAYRAPRELARLAQLVDDPLHPLVHREQGLPALPEPRRDLALPLRVDRAVEVAEERRLVADVRLVVVERLWKRLVRVAP